MDSLLEIKNRLIVYAENATTNLNHVNARELGAVIDMIKDLSEAIYYCSMVK